MDEVETMPSSELQLPNCCCTQYNSNKEYKGTSAGRSGSLLEEACLCVCFEANDSSSSLSTVSRPMEREVC